jgi:hypothetical protein
LFILGIAMTLVPMDFSTVDFIFAQSGNTLGQDGDGNEASQSEESSQSTNQNSMCVSGESTSLSCNNLSSDSIGASVPGEQGATGPEGPQSMEGKAYSVVGETATGNDSPTTSTANCESGDTVMGGGYDITIIALENTENIHSGPANGMTGWTATIDVHGTIGITAIAVCFDNP